MGEPDPRRLAQALLLRSALAAGDADPATVALMRSLESLARSGAADGTVDRRLCGALGSLLVGRGPDVHDYLAELAVYGSPADEEERHGCGCRLVAVPFGLPALRGADRRLILCDRCGIVGNVAADRPAPQLMPSPTGGLRITVPSGHVGWCCAGRQPVGGAAEVPTATQLSEGHTAEVDVRLVGAVGLRRWAVAVVSDGDYAIVQLPVRGDGAFGGPGRA